MIGVMARAAFAIPLLLAVASLSVAMWLTPSELDLWRKIVIGILNITLGFHAASALLAGAQGVKRWLECLAFPMLMLGFAYVPSGPGWMMLITGWVWRVIVGRVMK